MQIHYAAARGDIQAVTRELKNGVHVDSYTQDFYSNSKDVTPLMFAARSPHANVDMLNLLVEHGANVNAVSGGPIEISPLSLAAKSGDVAKIRYLLEVGANPNFQNSQRYTPLIEAAHSPRNSRTEVIKVLLDAGADPDVETTYGESVVSVASYFADFATIYLLLESGADPAPLQWMPLMHAIVFGDLKEVRVRLQQESPNDRRDRFRRSAWLLCVTFGDVSKAQLLREFGAVFEGNDLHWAVRIDNADMVKWLLFIGADPNAKDDYHRTPLIVAAAWGSTNCVRVLLEAGADINLHDSGHSKAINSADNPEVVRLLIDAGADINYVNGEGYNALKDAAERGRVEMVRALLEMGADPNASSLGETPLYVAVRSDEYKIVKLLLDAGADPNIRTSPDNWYPLQKVKSVATLQLLLDAGVDVTYRDYFGKSPIDYHSDPEIIAVLKIAEDIAHFNQSKRKSKKR
jgi:ankyrin repeat protein